MSCKELGQLFLLLSICFSAVLADDMETVYVRRIQDIIGATHNPEQANKWRDQLTAGGVWTDVDYTSGCPARRANWPAQDHFHRTIQMASLWYHDQVDTDLLSKISLALDFWFDRDFHEEDCINAGGNDRFNCPCSTPGLWNTNWYCQMILIPGLVGNACLLLKGHLTPTQLGNCTAQTSRAYVRIDGDPNGSMGPMTGANMIDVSSTGVSLALLTSNQVLMADALARYYNESQLTVGFGDGIKVDGSFMQHSSQIYNGNYGAVFMRNLLKIFIQTGDTSLAPPISVQSAFLTVMNGSEWFVYVKNNGVDDPRSPIRSWQYSVIGRMVSHKYEDWNGIGLNLDEILEGTKYWYNYASFAEIVARLNRTQDGVNPGGLIGTRYFQVSDYLVHRGGNYIVTLKMFSSRTTNSECNNNQNPFGFHLSDGNIYTYLKGNEYTNVYGAWDWNLIPGTTVDYGVTPLACNRVQFKGKEGFVGGVALGHAGIGVMTYTNPMSGTLHWTKTFFFFPNSYAVQFVGGVQSTNKSAMVVTTLDQRQRVGPIYVDGQILIQPVIRQTAQTFWHDRVGYRFLNPLTLIVDTTPKQSNWSAIGISQGNETQNLMSAYFEHPDEPGSDERFMYIAQLDIGSQEFSLETFEMGKTQVLKTMGPTTTSDARDIAIVRGAQFGTPNAPGERYVSLAFLTAGDYETGLVDIAGVATNGSVLLILQRDENDLTVWQVAVADPTQMLMNVNVVIHSQTESVELDIELPQGALVGSAAVKDFQFAKL